MNYLQRTVYNALCKNPALDESYAADFAVNRINQPIDLVLLDYGNLDRVASELGCTPEQLDNFVMITKALYNEGQCEQDTAENRAYVARIEAAMAERND